MGLFLTSPEYSLYLWHISQIKQKFILEVLQVCFQFVNSSIFCRKTFVIKKLKLEVTETISRTFHGICLRNLKIFRRGWENDFIHCWEILPHWPLTSASGHGSGVHPIQQQQRLRQLRPHQRLHLQHLLAVTARHLHREHGEERRPVTQRGHFTLVFSLFPMSAPCRCPPVKARASVNSARRPSQPSRLRPEPPPPSGSRQRWHFYIKLIITLTMARSYQDVNILGFSTY